MAALTDHYSYTHQNSKFSHDWSDAALVRSTCDGLAPVAAAGLAPVAAAAGGAADVTSLCKYLCDVPFCRTLHHFNFVMLDKYNTHNAFEIVPRLLVFYSMADDHIAH